jgi:hypothetical protein
MNPDSPEQYPSPRRDHKDGIQKRTWFIIVTAFVIPVAAILVPVLMNRSSDGPVSSESGASSSVSPSATPTAINTAPTVPETPQSPEHVAPVWHRRVHFPYGYGLDIDAASPRVEDPPDSSLDFHTSTGALSSENRSEISVGGGDGGKPTTATPSLSECIDAISYNTIDDFADVPVGRAICIASDAPESHMAAIRVLKWDSDEWDMDADVTIWNYARDGSSPGVS